MAMADFLCWRHEGVWQLGVVCGSLSEGEKGQCWSSTTGKNGTPVVYFCNIFSLPIEVVSKQRTQIYFLTKTFQGGQYKGGGM